jgi:hypothetical protein
VDQHGCQIAVEFLRREQQFHVQQVLVAAGSSVSPLHSLESAIADEKTYAKLGATWLPDRCTVLET